jgi:hypothetical protein
VASATILGVGLLARSSGAIQCSLVVIVALLLLRRDYRLLLAPLYGACLLMAGELAQRSIELRRQTRVERGVVGSRLMAVAVLAAVGGCAGALAAIAVTIAPDRSTVLSAAATIAVLAALATIVLLARARRRETPAEPSQ